MSERYAKELSALSLTYQATKAWDVSPLVRPLEKALKRPMAVIGSGGSFSVAAYCAGLHRQATGGLARALTPLSFLDTPANADTALLCVSASGRNADILAAFARGMEDELRPAIAFTLDANAPLVALAADVGYADFVIGPDLAEPDGFLAVNSILATCLCFARAYRSIAGKSDPFPADYSMFLSDTLRSRSLEAIAEDIRTWNGQRTISVLYSPDLEAAAIDLESRFVEAALGPLHIADFRNFGHGRHNWLAKRASETGVVSLAGDKQKKLAERTLKLLPHETAVARIDIAGDPDVAGLAALIVSLYVSAGAGGAIDVDPGRPGIPKFGRKLYRLSPPRRAPAQNPSPSTIRKIAAIKRVGGQISSELVETASNANLALLEQATIGAIALDYDGTICDPRRRFDPLPDNMAAALQRVIELGLPLGIATGRGQSVAKELRRALPKALWHRIIIGFYNGGEVTALADLDAPRSRVATALTQQIADMLLATRECADWIIEARTSQVSVTPPAPSHIDALTAHVERLVSSLEMPVQVVSSAHSVDVLVAGASKRVVLSAITESFGISPDSTLRIGDRGAAPGNDYELLNHVLGLSVDEVSPALDTCWRHSAPGHIGPRATLDYLDALVSGPGGVRLKAIELVSRRG